MSKNFKISFWLLLAFCGLFQAELVAARENVIDWYIKDFDSQIIVSKDSSLDITETIVADTGKGINKHGIFRVLPTSVNIEERKVKNPVELISITDENNRELKYSEIKNNDTVTWKIGDPNITVQGVNTYRIHYRVKNAIRFNNEKFDELYWNLNGNFWDLEIDSFHARIIFPSEISSQNAKVEYYSGLVGEKKSDLANFSWKNSNALEFATIKKLKIKEGITASIIFPKNIIHPYKPTFLEAFGQYLFLLIPLILLGLCFWLWKKFGDDPDNNKTIIAEYEVPGNLSPIELGMLMKNGSFSNAFITAEIVMLATKGLIEIKEIENKILFITSRDFVLTKKYNPEIEATLNSAQLEIFQRIFKNGSVVAISALKNVFYLGLKTIINAAKNELKSKGLIQTTGSQIAIGMRILAPFFVWVATIMLFDGKILLGVSLAACAAILLGFSFIMPKRTAEGVELNWKAKGFKLFIKTVDSQRAAFYEKENIFEKCLPYAIVFGMTKIWISRMQEIYGADFYASHTPVWYMGSKAMFNADSFGSAMESLATEIAANTSAPSGSGGAGSSGGGGGGGGGGGW